MGIRTLSDGAHAGRARERVCVGVCVHVRVCMCLCVRACVGRPACTGRVCVCVCARAVVPHHAGVCVCVCVRQRWWRQRRRG